MSKKIKAKKDKRRLLDNAIDEFKSEEDDFYGKSFEIGKLFELFLYKKILTEKHGLSEEDASEYMDPFGSGHERCADIAILNSEQNHLHLLEAKYRSNRKFDPKWIENVLYAIDPDKSDNIILNRDNDKYPDYLKNNLRNFKINSSSNTLEITLASNANIAKHRAKWNDDVKNLHKTIDKNKKIKCRVQFNLWDGNEVYDYYSQYNEPHDVKVQKLEENYNGKKRVFDATETLNLDNSQESLIAIMNGLEIVDWVEKDKHIFDENVRGFLGSTQASKGLIESISNDSKNFFHLNNGITCLTEKIYFDKGVYSFSPLHIINGCQTASQLKDYRKKASQQSEEERITNLRNLKVMVKITQLKKTTTKSGLGSKIIQSTNTQNNVSTADFRSSDDVHKRIETYLKKNKKLTFYGDSPYKTKIFYIFKRQKLKKTKDQLNIKMTDLAEAVYTFKFEPITISKNKKSLYEVEPVQDFPEEGQNNSRYWGVFGVSFEDEALSDSDIKNMISIFFLSQFINICMKEIRNSIDDKDSAEYIATQPIRFYLNGISKILDEIELKEALLMSCQQQKIYDVEKKELFKEILNEIKTIIIDMIYGEDDNKEKISVNIRNFQRTDSKYIRFLEKLKLSHKISFFKERFDDLLS